MRNLLLLSLLTVLVLPLHAATYVVTVAGLGGAEEYDTQFKQWASEMDKVLQKNGPEWHVETVTGASATKQGLRDLLNRIATSAQVDDAFVLMLIGHGTFDGNQYKFNVPGPDITAAELSSWLNGIHATRQLVVNMTSASGASLAELSRKHRIVITATKSGTEKNITAFARYWLEAMQNNAADVDKNGTVSALEAYRYADGKVAAYYSAAKLLATEHPLIDDTGSKQGVRSPSQSSGQGLQAAAFPIVRPPVDAAVAANPAKEKLIARRDQLEAAIDRLKFQKAAMPIDEYKRQLSALLVQLAQLQAEIDR